MAGQYEIEAKLRRGIEAARRGDKRAAQLLLREVLDADPRNELAWMWLASAVDSLDERRLCLRRALQINPNNTRAREALNRLGGDAPAPVRRGGVPTSAGDARAISISTLIFGALAVALIVVVLVVVSALTTQPDLAGPAGTVDAMAVFNPSPTPTIDPNTYTATPFLGIIVTRDPTALALPPTFTPTATATPPPSPSPSATPFPLSAFELLLARRADGAPQPDLYRAAGDGAGSALLGADFRDVVFDPSGERIAFVRDVIPEPVVDEEGEPVADTGFIASELFIAELNDVANARQITTMGGRVSAPTWAPNGIQLAFVSDISGEDNIWTITEDGNNLRLVADSPGNDRDPAWSPAGDRILFVSDDGSPGFTRLYSMTPEGEDIRLLSNLSGSSYHPRWSPLGRYIVFINDGNGDGDVYLAEADGTGTFLLTPDDGGAEDLWPVFTPDERWIAFLSNREGVGFELYVVNLRGDALTRLTDGEGSIQSFDYRPEIVLRLRRPS